MGVDELNSKFGMVGRVEFVERAPGIAVARLSSASSQCEIALHGAHVTRFQREGEPALLFLSEKSSFSRGKAIRGGVPLIFPWFGAHATDPSKPAHGFARTALSSVDSIDVSSPGSVSCALRLDSSEESLAHWPHAFNCLFKVTSGIDLEMTLEVRNNSPLPFSFETALHTYISVGDIRKVDITGLEQTGYIDKTDRMARRETGDTPLRIERETDSVFLGTTSSCVVRDRALGRRVIVEKSGSSSTIVWNPWREKARSLSDLGDDEWERFVCVESANVAGDAVTLASGESHTTSVKLRAELL